MTRYTVMTAIPYVNGTPHVGHALELVQADVLARHRRQRGDEVRFQTGTDDNALKNVQAAEAEGITAGRVRRPGGGALRRAARAAGPVVRRLHPHQLRPAAPARGGAALGRVRRRGDIYRKAYAGLYCVGCEQFYDADELTAGRALPGARHDRRSWSRRRTGSSGSAATRTSCAELISTDRLRIEPTSRKREVLSFIEAGLDDFSVSRSVARARGWGIPVPGDPDQVIYVWYDALANYITAPGYGTDEASFDQLVEPTAERVHVIGKGIIRFHAVYWPAMLLSAGICAARHHLRARVPDRRTVRRSASRRATPTTPSDLVARYGTDALRWWMLQRGARLRRHRLHRRPPGRPGQRGPGQQPRQPRQPDGVDAAPLPRRRGARRPVDVGRPTPRTSAGPARPRRPTIDDAPGRVRLPAGGRGGHGDRRRGNRYVEARAAVGAGQGRATGRDRLDAVLAELVATCRDIAEHLAPFLPGAAQRIRQQCDGDRLPPPQAGLPETGGMTGGRVPEAPAPGRRSPTG